MLVGCDCRLVAFLGMGLGGFGVNPFLFMGACRVVMVRCGLGLRDDFHALRFLLASSLGVRSDRLRDNAGWENARNQLPTRLNRTFI